MSTSSVLKENEQDCFTDEIMQNKWKCKRDYHVHMNSTEVRGELRLTMWALST